MPRLDYDGYAIERSRARRTTAAQRRAEDFRLTVLAAGVIVFTILCAIYGAWWG